MILRTVKEATNFYTSIEPFPLCCDALWDVAPNERIFRNV